LLKPTDPVASVKTSLAGLLRQAVNDAYGAHEKAFSDGMAKLVATETWSKLPAPEQNRILSDVGLTRPAKADIGTDEQLLASLEARPLTAQQAEADAVAGRVSRALELAAKHLEPKVRMISLERATLRTEHDVRNWVERQEKLLVEEIKQGPVLVS
jgi:hypothetical protein